MIQKQTQKHTGWLYSADTRAFPIEETLRHAGYSVHSHSHGIPAVRAFVSHPYNLIILDLKAPPGLREVDFKDKNELDDLIDLNDLISKVMRGSNGSVEYWRLGLHFLETIKLVGPNQDIPIYVLSPYKAEGDEEFPDARKVSMTSGATEYFDATSETAYIRLLDVVRTQLRR